MIFTVKKHEIYLLDSNFKDMQLKLNGESHRETHNDMKASKSERSKLNDENHRYACNASIKNDSNENAHAMEMI